MDLEGIMLSEMLDREKQMLYDLTYMKPKGKNIRKMKLIDKASQIKYIIYSLKWNEHLFYNLVSWQQFH